VPQLEVVLRGGMCNQLYQWAYAEMIREVAPVNVIYDSSIVNLGGIHLMQQLTKLFPELDVADRRRRPITALMSKPRWEIARYYQWFYPRWESFIHSTPQQGIDRIVAGKNSRVADPCIFPQDYFAHPEIARTLYARLSALHTIDEPHSAIHIRRGKDYLQQWKRAILPPEYYHEAVKYLSKDLPIWVISDDKEYAREVIAGMGDYAQNIKLIEGTDHYYDLLVLATAKEIVLSTSTYSWWGAYVAQSLDEIKAYYPSPFSPDWLTERLNFPDEKWIGIPRETFETVES